MVKDATFKATELRVLYQIEANCDGIIEGIKTQKTANGCKLDILGTKVEISFPFIEASGLNPHFRISTQGNEMFAEAVLYSGKEQSINLNSIDSLAVVSALSINGYLPETITIAKDSELVTANIQINENSLTVKGPYKPLKQVHSVLTNKVFINSKDIVAVTEEE